MSELNGFTLMFRMELLVRVHTLVLCLKAARTLKKKEEEVKQQLLERRKNRRNPMSANTNTLQRKPYFRGLPQSLGGSETRRQRIPEKGKQKIWVYVLRISEKDFEQNFSSP